MAFNTGNPVPSTDAKDLSDNAENFDGAINAQTDTWVDRLGLSRDTVTGRLKKMGYAVPVAYAVSIVFGINDNVKTVEEANVVYAPLPSALPFTTSGTFIGDDDARFFTVQSNLITDLSQDYVFLTEAAMVASLLVFPLNKPLSINDENNSFSNYIVKSSGDAELGDINIGVGLWAVKLHKNNSKWDQEGFNAGGSVADAPNVIAGHSLNHVVSDTHSCTIAGGGSTNRENVIGGLASSVNTATSNINPAPVLGTQSQFCVIGGGYDNVVNGLANVITAGQHCLIDLPANHGSIHGGSINSILGGSYNTIGGGTRNTDSSTSGNNVTAGGADHTVLDGSVNAVISGGSFNITSATFVTVSGGQANNVGSDNGVIGGGASNTIVDANTNAVIAGGNGNTIDGSGQAPLIAGGIQNHATGNGATVHGGRENDSQQQYSQTSGFQAKSERAGQVATAAGQFATKGDAQTSSIILKAQTTDATVTNLADIGGGVSFPSTGSVAFGYLMRIVGHRTDVEGDDAVIILEGMATRGAAGAGVITAFADRVVATAGAVTWAAEAYYSGASLRVRVTGEAAKSINWVANVEFTESIG